MLLAHKLPVTIPDTAAVSIPSCMNAIAPIVREQLIPVISMDRAKGYHIYSY